MLLEEQAPIIVTVAVQTGAFIYWIGRLAQKVENLKEDIHDLKENSVRADVYLVEKEAIQRQLDSLRDKLRTRAQHETT